MPLAPIPRFYKRKKTVKSFLNNEQIQPALKKSLKIIGRKLIIFGSNKMKLSLNALKDTDYSCWFLKKSEKKSKLKSSNISRQAKN